MYVVKDLVECWENCPKPDDSDIAPTPAYELERQKGDAKFLHSMGICFPVETDER